MTSETDCLALSVSIDGTKHAKGIKMSTAYNYMFGGSFPQHIIVFYGLDSDVIKKMISNKNGEVKLAHEVKIAVITFQKYRKGEIPYKIIAGCPQSSNEARNFNQLVVTSIHELLLETRKCTLLNVCIDGISMD